MPLTGVGGLRHGGRLEERVQLWACLEMGLEKIALFFWSPGERLTLEILVWEPKPV